MEESVCRAVGSNNCVSRVIYIIKDCTNHSMCEGGESRDGVHLLSPLSLAVNSYVCISTNYTILIRHIVNGNWHLAQNFCLTISSSKTMTIIINSLFL